MSTASQEIVARPVEGARQARGQGAGLTVAALMAWSVCCGAAGGYLGYEAATRAAATALSAELALRPRIAVMNMNDWMGDASVPASVADMATAFSEVNRVIQRANEEAVLLLDVNAVHAAPPATLLKPRSAVPATATAEATAP